VSSANGKSTNAVLLVLAALLAAVGIAFIYSAGQLAAGRRPPSDYYQMQIVGAVMGGVLMLVVCRVPLRILEKIAAPAYLISLGLLLLPLFLSSSSSRPDRWIHFAGVQIQPSEFAKLGVILFLAKTLASRRRTLESLRDLILPCAIAAIPAALVILQPNLGTGIVFGVILVAMLFWAGAPPLLLFLLLSPAVSLLLSFSFALWSTFIVGIGVLLYLAKPSILETLYTVGMNVVMGVVTLPLWNSLADYQQKRLLTFLEPETDPRGAGWHILQSQVAVGSGGVLGQGFLHGSQKRLAFLPEQHTDFIFSVVGEEMGLLGVILALVLFALFINEGVRIAQSSTDPFGSTVAFGLVALFATHIVINVAMTVGMMPITGLPLPFFSYGRSFLLASFLAVGLLERVWRERFARRI
jgi:rod shape determining protein RodA